MRRMLPLLLCSSALSTGCALSSDPLALPPTEIRVERLAPPPALLACAADPDVPEGPRDQGAIAGYILLLWEAGDDCRGKVAALRKLYDPAPSGPR